MGAFTSYEEVELRAAIFRTSAVTVRANSTLYNTVGQRVMLGTSDLSVYEVVTGGTSAGSAPSFNTGIGSTTADGTVTWLTCKQGLPKRQLFVGLFTVTPLETTAGTEVVGGNYARVSTNVDPSDTNWSAPDATGGLTANNLDIVFNAPSGNWGSITGFGIFDRLTGGNMLFFGDLTTPKTVNNGDPAPRFPAGSLQVTFD